MWIIVYLGASCWWTAVCLFIFNQPVCVYAACGRKAHETGIRPVFAAVDSFAEPPKATTNSRHVTHL